MMKEDFEGTFLWCEEVKKKRKEKEEGNLNKEAANLGLRNSPG